LIICRKKTQSTGAKREIYKYLQINIYSQLFLQELTKNKQLTVEKKKSSKIQAFLLFFLKKEKKKRGI